jgi:DNA-binding beta-propeller fold protein YncE
VLDLASGALVRHVDTGRCQGVAGDFGGRGGKYFVSVSREQKVVILDRGTLEKRKEISLTGPADAIAYDSENKRAYACHDDGTHVWVVDGPSEQLAATIDIPEGPEYIVYDRETKTIFQNIAGKNLVISIDPSSNKVVKQWPSDPATTPHGLAVDGRAHRLFTAGSNGKLAVIDFESGKLLGSVDIAPRVDQIASDPQRRRIYCACRGAVSVVEETAEGAKSLGNVEVPAGVHTIAVDPRTHAVWVSYSDTKDSYVMKLTPVEGKGG